MITSSSLQELVMRNLPNIYSISSKMNKLWFKVFESIKMHSFVRQLYTRFTSDYFLLFKNKGSPRSSRLSFVHYFQFWFLLQLTFNKLFLLRETYHGSRLIIYILEPVRNTFNPVRDILLKLLFKVENLYENPLNSRYSRPREKTAQNMGLNRRTCSLMARSSELVVFRRREIWTRNGRRRATASNEETNRSDGWRFLARGFYFDVCRAIEWF